MDDLISRQAAIDAIERNAYRHTYLDQITTIIAKLPAADFNGYTERLWKEAYERGKREAEPRKGKWKEVQVVIGRDGDFTTKEYECEICGYRQYFPENYCGRCGTRMED